MTKLWAEGLENRGSNPRRIGICLSSASLLAVESTHASVHWVPQLSPEMKLITHRHLVPRKECVEPHLHSSCLHVIIKYSYNSNFYCCVPLRTQLILFIQVKNWYGLTYFPNRVYAYINIRILHVFVRSLNDFFLLRGTHIASLCQEKYLTLRRMK